MQNVPKAREAERAAGASHPMQQETEAGFQLSGHLGSRYAYDLWSPAGSHIAHN